jgi:hypothetical protein
MLSLIPRKTPSYPAVLNLRVGEFVEVRSPGEILQSLDAEGKLEALPFMPEMLKSCGKRFRVYKRADKTCDTIDKTGARRMDNAVHLEGLRCDGEAHGGCQAGCLVFWKEAWLKRVQAHDAEHFTPARDEKTPNLQAMLMKAALVEVCSSKPEATTFSCQATELKKATSALAWWDLRQYIRDVRSGNVAVMEVIRAFLFWLFTKTLRLGAYRAQIWAFDKIQQLRNGVPYPYKDGELTKTPAQTLNLQPGELVEVKSHDEIVKTLDTRNRNRGMSFDVEMVQYCGKKYRVLRRVERIINERTGRMMQMQNDCIILDGAICSGNFSCQRLFCPRSIYPYWREIWLKRVA